MNKKQKAQIIFNQLWCDSGNNNRTQIVESFMSNLDMSKAGASTYYTNCKKANLPKIKSPNLPIKSVLDVNPQWKINALKKHHDTCKLAEKLFDVDLSNLEINFDLKGISAGQAYRQNSYHGWDYGVRYHPKACRDFPEHAIDMTIPHEIAHIVCYMKPLLGNKHDNGWKQVCKQLGGNGKRCHSLDSISSKKRVRYVYNISGRDIRLGPKIHKNIQNNSIDYRASECGTEILAENFIKEIHI